MKNLKQLLRKNKDIVGSWFFFVISIYFIHGIDAIIRLRKGGHLGEYTELGMPIHSVSKEGFPEWLFIMVSGTVMLIAAYYLGRGLVFSNWRKQTIQRRFLGILFFSLHIGVAAVVYTFIGLSYVLGTGIDSL